MGDNPARDARRDGFLRTLRLSAEFVFQDMNGVVLTILEELGR